MTQKEQLVELFENAPGHSNARYKSHKEMMEDLADYLLSNGVIVPPCKVGDVVYCVALQSVAPFIKQETVERIQYTGQGFYYGMQKGIYFEDEVFFTREEAEQALKERAANA